MQMKPLLIKMQSFILFLLKKMFWHNSIEKCKSNQRKRKEAVYTNFSPILFNIDKANTFNIFPISYLLNACNQSIRTT